jgi:NAD(P)-dependent dehydrogenase (short-subunit alcohol dehydrogenase family)
MKDVQGKVAFITGAASGVGLGMATVFAGAGMKVVLADIRGAELDGAAQSLAAQPDAIHTIRLDVTDRVAMARAADETERRFGKVHVLCNNAGINWFGPMDEATYDDWDWIMGVNLHGVINGLVTFIPRIKAHGEGGHIVNTASMAAFCAGPGAGIYTASKFAVRGISESLWYTLAPKNIGVSVLCPGLVRSQIYKSEEIRPAGLKHSAQLPTTEFTQRLGTVHESGMDPIEVGEKVLRAIRRNDLYILTHPDHKDEVRELFDIVIAAFPDEPVPPQRAAIEEGRRTQAARLRQQFVWR